MDDANNKQRTTHPTSNNHIREVINNKNNILLLPAIVENKKYIMS